MDYPDPLKPFHWNSEKNDLLIAERGVSFEQIVIAIAQDGLRDIRVHPNGERYPNQRLLLVEFENYIYLVPVVEETTHHFLKTIIPSRKATQELLRRKDPNDPSH